MTKTKMKEGHRPITVKCKWDGERKQLVSHQLGSRDLTGADCISSNRLKNSLYYSKVLSHIFIHNCCSLLPLPLLLILFLLLAVIIHKDPGEETVLGVEDIQICKAWSLPEGGSLFICKYNKKYTTA